MIQLLAMGYLIKIEKIPVDHPELLNSDRLSPKECDLNLNFG